MLFGLGRRAQQLHKALMVFYVVSIYSITSRYGGTYTLPLLVCFTDQRTVQSYP